MSEHTREYATPWFSVIKSGRYHWIEEAGAHHGAAILPVKNECILLLERRRAA